MAKKVEKWVKDVEELSKIAVEEPQAALSAFTKAICHRWSFMQRTISDAGHLFQPLEDAIRDIFIPSIIGRKINDLERRIFALPVRMGGLGITNPVESAKHEYHTSKCVTRNLVEIMIKQELTFENFNQEDVEKEIKRCTNEKLDRYKEELQQITEVADSKTKRVLKLAEEKGSGAWLTALPIQSLGYTLNKQEFRDSVALRYGWRITGTPSHCGCGQKNNIDHSLSCKLGGAP